MKLSEFQEIPLSDLKPKFTEFTATRGVLRILKPAEERTRATGLIFLCPDCKGYKNKEHYLIFLFQDSRVPEHARPRGRFLPSREDGKLLSTSCPPEDPNSLCLHQLTDDELRWPVQTSTELHPKDVCGWTGTLKHGVVRFKPRKKSFVERLRAR